MANAHLPLKCPYSLSNSGVFIPLQGEIVSVIQGTKIPLIRSLLRVKSRKDEQFFPKHSSYRTSVQTSAFIRVTQGSRISYYSLMLFNADAFKGHMHVFAGRVKVVSHSFCRTSAIFKYFCPLSNYYKTKNMLCL